MYNNVNDITISSRYLGFRNIKPVSSYFWFTLKTKIWIMKEKKISNALRTNATMPAFSILHAVVRVIWPRKLRNPTANKRIHPIIVVGKSVSHNILSNDVKWSPSLTIRRQMHPTRLKHAIMLNVGIPENIKIYWGKDTSYSRNDVLNLTWTLWYVPLIIRKKTNILGSKNTANMTKMIAA